MPSSDVLQYCVVSRRTGGAEVLFVVDRTDSDAVLGVFFAVAHAEMFCDYMNDNCGEYRAV
jgi:hypothetical protein